MLTKITAEIDQYRTGTVELMEGVSFSTAKIIRRIGLYKTETYPKGKLDSQGNYKYWFNIISPRVSAEIKNIDFDTKDIMLFSDSEGDDMRILLANAALKDWLHETDQAEKLNEAVEQGPEWGSVVWKKDPTEGYKIMDLTNLMVLNQTAKSIEDSDVVEQECLYATDLLKMSNTWKNVDELIKAYKPTGNKKSEFYIYERNGEMSEKEYNVAMGIKKEGSPSVFVLAKLIAGGTEQYKPTQILFCGPIDEMPYKEFHRSTYAGRWLRKGLYETLFDVQTRANEIGNQIARGLEWSSKTVFKSSDRLIAQNIITDLQNGDIIKATDLTQVEVRMQGMDQLIADWNRLMVLADQLANSYEVVTGGNLPSGTPFALASQQNFNANKLFDFIREKLGVAFQDLLEDWVLDDAIKALKARDILRLTNDGGSLSRYYSALVDDWYIQNLLSFPPHSNEVASTVKAQKLAELMQNQDAVIPLEEGMWADFAPRVRVVITGENYNLASELQTLQSFIALEQDPVRRTALIEMAMKKKNIDIATLPKSPPAQPTQQVTAMSGTPLAASPMMSPMAARVSSSTQ